MHLEWALPPRTWNGHFIIHFAKLFHEGNVPVHHQAQGVQPAPRSQVDAGPNELRQKLLDTLGWMRTLKREAGTSVALAQQHLGRGEGSSRARPYL